MHSKFLVYTKPELEADLWILDRDETWPGSVQETGETKTKKKTDMNQDRDTKGKGRCFMEFR
jgi:hypothetical protein